MGVVESRKKLKLLQNSQSWPVDSEEVSVVEEEVDSEVVAVVVVSGEAEEADLEADSEVHQEEDLMVDMEVEEEEEVSVVEVVARQGTAHQEEGMVEEAEVMQQEVTGILPDRTVAEDTMTHLEGPLQNVADIEGPFATLLYLCAHISNTSSIHQTLSCECCESAGCMWTLRDKNKALTHKRRSE